MTIRKTLYILKDHDENMIGHDNEHLITFAPMLKQFCLERAIARTHNSTYQKDGGSCSKDSFVVNGSLVFQINFCGKSPALQVAANR